MAKTFQIVSAAILTSAAAIGCGSEAVGTSAPHAPATAGAPAVATQVLPAAAGSGVAAAPVIPTMPVVTPAAASQVPVVAAPNAPVAPITPAPAVGGSLPCDTASIVEKNCQTCHSAQPKFGAPMALVTAADFGKPSPTNPALTVAQSAKARINATDNKRMPPASSTALSAADLASFNKWLDGGALAGAGGVCPTGGQTGVVAAGASDLKKPDPAAIDSDPSVKCYKLTAHGATKEEPFKVGLATDAYYNFTFNAPWQGTQYAKAFRTKTDNLQVIHHWLLFKEGGPVADGATAPSSGAHPGGQLVHGWAPGGEDLIMTDEVGIEMPSTGYTLELHYNSKDPNAMDRSGLEICVTPNKPKNIAGISWLGTDAIGGTSATGTCAPDTGQMIRVLGGTPHMHVAGTRMKVEILRTDGKTEILHDAPFDFNYQRAYNYMDRQLWLMPGDSVKTTCTYNKPVTFGEGTGDEMCYFFTLHYPVNALTSAGLGQVIHGPNTCGVL